MTRPDVTALEALLDRHTLPTPSRQALFAALERLGPHPGEAQRERAEIVSTLHMCLEREPPGAISAPLFELLWTLALQGEYPRRCLERDAALVDYLRERGLEQVDTRPEAIEAMWRAEITAALKGAGDAVPARRACVLATMRLFKSRESLAIYAKESCGSYGVRETTSAIAALAIAALRVALWQAGELLDAAALTSQICVFGMGKLGGLELNYSSDIDLILTCADAVAQDPAAHRRAEQVVREMVALIDEVTARGQVFRVDLRLRPEGSRGALLPASSALIRYYLSWGRTWERSAMLKARAVAGDVALGEEVLRALEPFIYRRYLDFNAIDDLRQMKEMVNRNAQQASVTGRVEQPRQDAEAPPASGRPAEAPALKGATLERLRQQRRQAPASHSRAALLRARAMQRQQRGGSPLGDEPQAPATPEVAASSPQDEASGEHYKRFDGVLGWDVKIGAGGIREIEFFVQAIQLVHCGTREALRVRGTLEALDRLLYAGLVPHEDYTVLSDAYDFYRRLEHRIQMEHDRQEHRLPEQSERLDLMAARLGLERERLRAMIRQHRQGVAEIFSRLFMQSAQVSERPTLATAANAELDGLVRVEQEEDASSSEIAILRQAGFERPRQVAGQLQILREKQHGPFSIQARQSMRELGRYLLKTSAAAPRPEQAFGFISRLVTQVGDRDWFWRMLAENPHATRLLVHVFGSSELLANILLRDPNVVSRLLGVGSVSVEREPEELERELEFSLSTTQDPAHRMGKIHRFQQEEILRLGLHEIGGAASTQATTRQLAQLAEVVLRVVLQQVWENLRQREQLFEAPEQAMDLPFCVLGMGKLGGRELGFGSDLDLIFVCEADEARGVSLSLLAKLAQRLVRALSALSAEGRLYEVDTRLRPSGRQGTLVVTLEAMRSYHAQLAGLWERQALLRARPLTGTASLQAEVARLREELAFEAPLPQDAALQMAQMRDRMVSAARQEGGASGFDIKVDRGGIVELEFIAQYLQLWWSEAARPELAATLEQASPGASLDRGARSQNTHEALCGLSRSEAVQARYEALDLEQLARDYMVLRRIELRLKLGSTTHETRLPHDAAARRQLARTLGFHGEEALAQLDFLVEQITSRVRQSAEQLFRPE